MTTSTTLIVGSEPHDEASNEAGADRLDRWLARHLPEHSRSVIQRWIKEGSVVVNDQPSRANQRLLPGDRIDLNLPDLPRSTELRAEEIPLAVLYEDQDLIVVDKPAGLVVHPAPGHAGGTLVNAILHHVPDLAGIGGELRPGIVHRLDKDTSGVIVVAKHDAALRHLQAQFKSRKVEKQYIALVEGKIEEEQGRIVAPIGRDPRNRKRQTVILAENPGALKARPATTEYKVLAQFTVPLRNAPGRGTFTLVQAHPITGRTHQIRVHFAWLGHPLVGDPIYGLRRQRLPVPRLFLHAARLAFALPSTGERVEFSAPLPAELQQVLHDLDQAASA
ncbi:MAG: RluA family pseudouridine synthase [Caldilineaceae bacterium]|nr:RluA family pseudouridine synthase [Caldilineaceae bacterium]